MCGVGKGSFGGSRWGYGSDGRVAECNNSRAVELATLLKGIFNLSLHWKNTNRFVALQAVMSYSSLLELWLW